MKRVLKVFLLILIFTASATGLFAQRTVTGTVIDSDKQPVIGANVVVKGTTTGAITDVNGKYSLNVPSPASLITCSFIGYVSKEVVAGSSSVIDFTLETEATALNEVVVVGYGVVKKRDITGSVASVSGQMIAAVPVANAAQALTGKLAGVTVVSQDGRPDASISIRVRGGGSISQSNDPLFIVDGFPVSSISDIPGDQIETIDVLKDASSTAIYGARGANGVIIVSTKSGKSGKLTISYNGYAQFNQPTKYLETLNAYDYIAYNWAYAKAMSTGYADAWAQLWAIGSYTSASNPTGIDYYKNVKATNYSKEAYGSSFSQNHSLSISDGTDRTKYLFSLNYNDNDGMKVNSWYKRINASFKLDQKIFKKLNFSLDLRYTDVDDMGNESTTNGKGSILSTSYQFRPIATSDVKGELNDQINTQLGMFDQVLQDVFNPVARMSDYSPESKNRSLFSNAALSWNIIKGLTARSEVGLNNYWNKGYTWSGAVYNNYYDATGVKTFGGNAAISASEGWNIRWVNTLSYDINSLGKGQTLNIMAGQEITNSYSSSFNIWGNQYPVSFDADRAFGMMKSYFVPAAGVTTVYYGIGSSTGTPNRLQSYFGRVNYSILNRYLLTATFRADGSSRFAPTHRWGYFPAAALGWRISEENFMKNIVWINNLKLRLSYGSVGNDGISANLWKNNWTSDGVTNYSINESMQPSYSPSSTTANPDLKWETTITRNLGLDFAFLKSRIYGTFDVYKNSTKDLLMLTSIPPYSGSSQTYENIGSTSNKGIEIALNGDILRSKDFNLTVGFNLNINRGRVDELASGVNGLYKTQWGSSMTQPNTGDYILVQGQPVGLVRGYTYEGWYTIDDFNYVGGIYTLKSGVADIGSGILGTVQGTTANKPAGQSAYPGVIKFKDISGPAGTPDGIVNEYDVSVIGNMNPKHTGGLNINGSYKSFDFALNFNWSYGNQIYNANYLAAMYGSKEDGLYRNRLSILADAYKIFDIQSGQIVSVTDTAALRALNVNAKTFLPYQENPICSTLGIEDGSFLRLNTVTIGYTLPKSLTTKANISKLRIYGSIYNALTITNYSGLDPEVNTNTSQGGATYPTTGLDWGSYPRARSFTLGLNIEF